MHTCPPLFCLLCIPQEHMGDKSENWGRLTSPPPYFVLCVFLRKIWGIDLKTGVDLNNVFYTKQNEMAYRSSTESSETGDGQI